MPALGEQLFLWCEQCRLDLVEFHQKPENAIPDWPFDDEDAQKRVSQQMAERERRRDSVIIGDVISPAFPEDVNPLEGDPTPPNRHG